MAFDFPSSPSDGQVFTPSGGPSYIYNAAGTKWLVSATPFTGQPLDALLTSIAALTFGANNYIYGTGTDTAAVATVTSFMRGVLDDTTAVAALTTLGVLSGSYTPALSNNANIDASTSYMARYIRVGDVVIVTGRVDVDPTSGANVSTVLNIGLPFASDLTLSESQCGGTFTVAGSPGGIIIGEPITNAAQAFFLSSISTSAGCGFAFTYVVV